LPTDILKRYEIDLMYFYIETETGKFRDVAEITAQNVFEYVENGGQHLVSKPPMVEEFRDFFNQNDPVPQSRGRTGFALPVDYQRCDPDVIQDRSAKIRYNFRNTLAIKAGLYYNVS